MHARIDRKSIAGKRYSFVGELRVESWS